MRNNNLYVISYGDLKLGTHNFDFQLSSDFFSIFPDSELTNGNCTVDIVLDKHSSFLELKIKIRGEVVVECDRCLESLSMPVEFDSLLIIKYSSEIQSPEFEINVEQEDIIWVNINDNFIDLSQYFFDSINLSLPISRIHANDENGNSKCNKDMLERFIQG